MSDFVQVGTCWINLDYVTYVDTDCEDGKGVKFCFTPNWWIFAEGATKEDINKLFEKEEETA